MQGFLDFDESFGTCITATLTLFLSNNTPSSGSLFPIPLALNCRTLNVLSFLRQMEQALEMVRVVVVLIAGVLRPSRGRRSLRTDPSQKTREQQTVRIKMISISSF